MGNILNQMQQPQQQQQLLQQQVDEQQAQQKSGPPTARRVRLRSPSPGDAASPSRSDSQKMSQNMGEEARDGLEKQICERRAAAKNRQVEEIEALKKKEPRSR